MISAMTIGRSLMMRQLMQTPPTGVMALSISSAVVPGAKFFAKTMYGPARPLIDIPLELFAGPTTLTWAFRAGVEVELPRDAYRRSVRVKVGCFGERRGACGPRAADGLFRSCKSWVHSALTLPAAGFAMDRATVLLWVVGIGRYSLFQRYVQRLSNVYSPS